MRKRGLSLITTNSSFSGGIHTSIDNPALVAQRRSQIVRAAVPLFYKQGFHGTRVREIAASLKVNSATIYQYIGTKEDILVLIYEDFWVALSELLAEQPEPTGYVDSLQALFLQYVRLCEKRREDFLIFYRESNHFSPQARKATRAATVRIVDSFSELIAAGAGTGELVCENPRLVGHMLEMLGQQWILKRPILMEQFGGVAAYGDAQWEILETLLEVSRTASKLTP